MYINCYEVQGFHIMSSIFKLQTHICALTAESMMAQNQFSWWELLHLDFFRSWTLHVSPNWLLISSSWLSLLFLSHLLALYCLFGFNFFYLFSNHLIHLFFLCLLTPHLTVKRAGTINVDLQPMPVSLSIHPSLSLHLCPTPSSVLGQKLLCERHIRRTKAASNSGSQKGHDDAQPPGSVLSPYQQT